LETLQDLLAVLCGLQLILDRFACCFVRSSVLSAVAGGSSQQATEGGAGQAEGGAE